MVLLTYNNLDLETQQKLLVKSMKDVENKFGNSLKTFAKKHNLNYDDLLEEEAMRNLYNYKYKFTV